MRRGVGGGGKGVRAGSGDGVRERENKFDKLGISCNDGIDSVECEGGGVAVGSGGGAGARLITNADSARRACPTW